jgi:hypothetical protein
MKKHELLQFSAPLLQQLYRAGLDVSDVAKLEIYNEYRKVAVHKRSGAALTVAERKGISERRVYQIVKELEGEVEV